MDPDITWRTVNDPETGIVERARAALALLGWLIADGFSPDGVTREAVLEYCQQTIVIALDQFDEVLYAVQLLVDTLPTDTEVV